MKRMLLGLGCTLAAVPGLMAQDGTPSARLARPSAALGRPIAVRAQAPDITPAGALDEPKTMPKGTVNESTAPPGTLPVPGPMVPPITSGAPTTVLPPGPPVPTGPVIIDPPGTPFPGGMVGGPLLGGPPMPGIIGQPGSPSNWYVAAEALAIWISNYKMPPLVTVGPAFSGANLGATGVTSIFSGESADFNPRYGGRITLGYWLNPCWAVELTGFYARPASHGITAHSGGYPDQDLARPFFSLNRGIETSELIGRPGVAAGSVQADQTTNFFGGELNARYRFWEGMYNRLDLIGGVRYMYLDERLSLLEQTTGLAGAGPFVGVGGTVNDTFFTRNQFYGVQIGGAFTHVEGSWTFGLNMKLAAGLNSQTTEVSGSTATTAGPGNRPGGLLALDSNIGSYNHRQFSLIPEVGVTVGYDLTSRLRVFAGYNILYWTNVARPGQAIDRVLDENRISGFPPAPPATGTRPVNTGGVDNVWVQGVSLGLLYRW